jgi:hypothetical protein
MSWTVSVEKAREYIEQLDFGYLVDTMCSEAYPLPRWAREEARTACQLYKNFLYLNKCHPQQILVPTREIDECWHNHILHTQKYHRDCMHIFGFYLHHAPLDPNENPQELLSHYEKTKQLYFDTFKQSLILHRSE